MPYRSTPERRPSAQTDATRRFADDPAAQAATISTARLDTVKAADFDAVFYPGGHTARCWDLASAASIALIGPPSGKTRFTAVCHHRLCCVTPKGADGKPVVAGKAVTGFTNSEEAAVGLTGVVPFLVEDMLKGQRRALRRRSRLGGPRRDRRPAHHRPESSLVRGGSRGLAEAAGLIRRRAARGRRSARALCHLKRRPGTGLRRYDGLNRSALAGAHSRYGGQGRPNGLTRRTGTTSGARSTFGEAHHARHLRRYVTPCRHGAQSRTHARSSHHATPAALASSCQGRRCTGYRPAPVRRAESQCACGCAFKIRRSGAVKWPDASHRSGQPSRSTLAEAHRARHCG